MGEIAENNQWFEGKGTVRREYEKVFGAVVNTVAARGFSMFPGYGVEALTGAEIESKLKLVELNKSIMGGAIERELRAYGLENDIALKSGLMDWEMRKQVLLTELQKELAGQKAVRDMTEEEIAELVLEQEFREVAILIAKTAIEMELEGIKKMMEEVDLSTYPLKRQLSAAQLVTAQRKQAVIPYILATIEAQREAMDAEENIIMPARQTKAETEQAMGDKLLEIIPYLEQKAQKTIELTTVQRSLMPLMTEKATATEALADEIIAQLSNRIEIASTKVQMATERGAKLADDLETMELELEEQGARLEVELKRIDIEVERANARKTLADDLRTQVGEIKTAATAAATAENTYEKLVSSSGHDQKMKELGLKSDRISAEAYLINKEAAAIDQMASDDEYNEQQLAEKTAAAKVTQELVHLLK